MSFLTKIQHKIAVGERITRQEAIDLMRWPNLTELGALADEARNKWAGPEVYFNQNAHINYSNVCAIHCRFCAFGRKEGADGAYTYSLEDMVQLAGQYYAQGAREIHMVGGLHPKLPFEHYLETLRTLTTTYAGLHIKGFTAVEIDHFHRISGLSVEEVLIQLKASGYGSLSGGGAEIFNPKVRDMICRPKISGERWLEIHRTAHGLGIRSTATMLYGHVESVEDRVDHLLSLRTLQDETGGFTAFVPLAFHPENTDFAYLPGPTAYDDMRVMAVSRLVLDNFHAIKAYWIMMTPALSQVALWFGANDLDGTVREEKIYHDAGAVTPKEQGIAEFISAIREAGRVPVERDSVYNKVHVYA